MGDIEGFPPSSQTPPGWYPDPSGAGGLRFWDGSRWTDQYASPPVPPVAPLPPTYSPPGGSTPPQAMSGCLKVFLVGLAVAAVGAISLVIALVFIGNRVV